MAQLKDYARVLRSKNAGAFVLTIDVIFASEDDYRRIIEAGVLDPDAVAAAYRVNSSDVMVIPYPQVCSVKVTMPRRHGSGDVADADVYGAQQHVPLMLMPVPAASAA